MKATESKGSPVTSKQELCDQLQKLQAEVNELALRLCGCNGSDYHVIWTNLANARAYLATALEASQHLKEQNLPTLLQDC